MLLIVPTPLLPSNLPRAAAAAHPLLAASRSVLLAAAPGACAFGARAAAARDILHSNPAKFPAIVSRLYTPPFRPQCPISCAAASPALQPACTCVTTHTALRSSCLLRRFSSSASGNNGQISSRVIFQPALTIPRFLRAFALTQAAVCVINGAFLAISHNPLTGGALKSVCAMYITRCLCACLPSHCCPSPLCRPLALTSLPSDTPSSAPV